MHPFGGTPICPKCSKAVYAAEQIMGPGRRLYHKPCLACTSCGKRLDSYNLLEHDQEPYCKNCHVRLFATRTLGLQNLPNRDEVPLTSPPTSPVRNGFPSPTRTGFSSPTRTGFSSPTRAVSPPARSTPGPPLPARRHATGGGSIGDCSAFPPPSPGAPVLRPTRALSPVRGAAYRSPVLEDVPDEAPAEYEEEPAAQAVPTAHTGRGQGGLPRTVPLSPIKSRLGEDATDATAARSPDTTPHMTGTVHLVPSATGTRYGRALAPMATGSGTPRQWGLGGANPACGRCGKTVYFAEQVKAIGKTYHKGCLRCSECNTTLDSTKLTERDGEPYCRRCYSKLYGPQGSGYALLGKAGG
ncbi:hypothetical protein FOMPIDRAFT_90481 [Fomitopsis schrenkii]|uniref:LIM zinc-binding domain-containing protein n=1 Tax=Fomitopsis schrenkii TaxID=2126942 RepID=S8E629_FOMSC|nr:hypothetical protein FOMPIDRAFT_90481 [Fomitopsis schrenkii]